MFKSLSQSTQRLSATFNNHYLVTQSVFASGAMLIAAPLIKLAGDYLHHHHRHDPGPPSTPHH
ncbi:hypothetical protein [Frateuria aurantia]|uniref:Uncharacterized protein n=1 Tax=Frateuria aurantia (strain ATCC 33424 / DSM 6220 / KCTC 2777 / LMG 1558 / NBRC 3245 / NCIMB 13370) TaxID=767434 RepID=H8KYY8_FRAAD|nr:hypothetical protein [Frateuria aurantia]AFC87018.1 hypothetical protein Fraau_2675 [Frateuria aurantia DSM 6220]